MFLTLLCTDIADVFISTSFVVVTSAAKGSSLGKKKQLYLISCPVFPYLLRKVCMHKYVSMTSFVQGVKKDFD